MKLAEVKTLYEANARQLGPMLDLLKADVERDRVVSLVSVCYRDGALDVRGLGENDLRLTYALLTAARNMIEQHMIDELAAAFTQE